MIYRMVMAMKYGQTSQNILENSKKVKNKERENTFRVIQHNIKENGKMEN